jgi:hypothetical protein
VPNAAKMPRKTSRQMFHQGSFTEPINGLVKFKFSFTGAFSSRAQ